MRGLTVLLATFLALVAPAMGQSTGVLSQSFSLAAPGLGPVLNLNGQSTCSVTVTNGASFSLTAQTASDGPTNPQTWNTATAIGSSGVVTALGTYGGNIGAGLGNTNFRFVLSSLGTGPLGGVESCTPATSGGVSLSPSAPQSGNIAVTGYGNFGGYGFAGATGDLQAARSASTGALILGATGGALCVLDYNISAASRETFGCPLNVTGTIDQPGYAQHGVVTVTTPTTCTALAACGSATVTFATAMVSAPGCVGSAQGYPQLVTTGSPSTTAVTFALYTLAAVSSAQAVPVAYVCQV